MSPAGRLDPQRRALAEQERDLRARVSDEALMQTQGWIRTTFGMGPSMGDRMLELFGGPKPIAGKGHLAQTTGRVGSGAFTNARAKRIVRE